jgi:hypothetical protein
VLVVLAAGRWLLRPLLYVIANSRLRELFTLAVLLVALASAWASQLAGLSMALGAFLAGMMLAETEYSHQVESVIRPFRDILLGLFFISVGMLLDFDMLWREFGLIAGLLVSMIVLKALIAAAATRVFVDSNFKAIRTGVTLAVGGEFGIALLTLLLQNNAIDRSIAQPLLVAVVLGMLLAPAILANNKRVARLILGERGPPKTAIEREDAATQAWRTRARHPLRLRPRRPERRRACSRRRASNTSRSISTRCACARAADRSARGVRRFRGRAGARGVGLANANAVVISFSDTRTSLAILRSLRRCAPTCRCWCARPTTRAARAQGRRRDRVVPEAFEASLMLASHVLMSLKVPPRPSCAPSPSCAATATRCCATSSRAAMHSERCAQFAEQCARWCCRPARGASASVSMKCGARARRWRSPASAARHSRPRAVRRYGIPGRRHRRDLRHAGGARACRSGAARGLRRRRTSAIVFFCDHLSSRFLGELADSGTPSRAPSSTPLRASSRQFTYTDRMRLELVLFQFFEIHEHVVRAG